MKASDLKLIRSVFKENLGPSWPIFLMKSGIYSNTVFKKTRWASTPGEESKYVKRIAIAPAAYLKLCERMDKEKAYEIMEQLLLPGCVDDMQSFVDTDSTIGKTAMERLMAFVEAYDTKGASQFMEKDVLQQDESTYHFMFTRCYVWDFMQETETPELTCIFCESDHRFFPKAFPEFEFSRGDSKENTLAYGKNQCEYLYKKKE